MFSTKCHIETPSLSVCVGYNDGMAMKAKLCIFFEQCHSSLAQHNVQITGLVVHSMLLMYSPDGINAIGSRVWEFDGIVSAYNG